MPPPPGLDGGFVSLGLWDEPDPWIPLPLPWAVPWPVPCAVPWPVPVGWGSTGAKPPKKKLKGV